MGQRGTVKNYMLRRVSIAAAEDRNGANPLVGFGFAAVAGE